MDQPTDSPEMVTPPTVPEGFLGGVTKSSSPVVSLKKHLPWIPVLLIILFLVSAGIATYFFLESQSLKSQLSQTNTPIPTHQPSEALAEVATANWQTYTLKNYQFKLPPEFITGSQSADIITAQSNLTDGLNFYFDLGAGVGFECINKIETYTLNAMNKSITIDSYQGMKADSSSACQTDTTNHHILMANLSNSAADPRDILVITFDSPQYNLNQAKELISQILSTFKFTDSATPTSTSTKSTTTPLAYLLPSGWQTITDPTNTYEVGFDPETQTATPNSNSADPQALWVTNKNLTNNPIYSPLDSSIIFRVKPYNGGSRHTFLETEILNEPLSQHNQGDSYQEKSYLIQNKNCIVLYSLQDMSAGHTTLGMCPISSTQALVFSSFSNSAKLEPTLKTLKFIN